MIIIYQLLYAKPSKTAVAARGREAGREGGREVGGGGRRGRVRLERDRLQR